MSDQFDDAPDDTTLPLTPTVHLASFPIAKNTAQPLYQPTSGREVGVGYIDEPLAPSDDEEDVDEEKDGEDGEWDEWEGDVEDEDWEVADGDFTKQFNRLRQHKSVSHPTSSPLIPLPARNHSSHHHPRPIPSSGPASASRNARSTFGPALPTPSASQARTKNPLAETPGVAHNPKQSAGRSREKDKADRATQEQVLDHRTKAVLQGLGRRGVVGEVGGCVSTGKEANVYFSTSPLEPPISHSPTFSYPTPYPASLALKIYKTSILSFKSRSAYITGDARFEHAYTGGGNARKMVKTWCEKEGRNLRRLYGEGIGRVPRVVEGRENVLVMEFLGDTEGRASPRLKDADIPTSHLPELYAELLITMRWMYHRCRLVHADLSEYNILYHNHHLSLIDVSQSVEHDHPRSFDFLRKDIQNVDEYFKRRGGGEVRTLGGRGTWDFVVNEKAGMEGSETEEGLKEVLRGLLDSGVGEGEEVVPSTEAGKPAGEEKPEETTAKQQKEMDDKVFMSSFIPRSLAEVYDPERDSAKVGRGEEADLIYADMVGLAVGGSKSADGVKPILRKKSVVEEDGQGEGEGRKKGVKWQDEVSEDWSGSEESGEEGMFDKKPRGFRHEDKEAKKERKKALKEETREKRKVKMPKAEKAKLVKKGGHGK